MWVIVLFWSALKKSSWNFNLLYSFLNLCMKKVQKKLSIAGNNYFFGIPRHRKKPKDHLISKCIFGVFISYETRTKTIRLEVPQQLDRNFTFVFRKNKRYQKDISKLTDLYREKVVQYSFFLKAGGHILNTKENFMYQNSCLNQ